MEPYLFRSSAIALALASPAYGDVDVYTNKTAWMAAAGEVTTIDFTGFPPNVTIITTQYQDQGIVFTDGQDVIEQSNNYPNDGFGLSGNKLGGAAYYPIRAVFTEPLVSIAAEHPGEIGFRLFSGGQMTYESDDLGGIGEGHFSGLVSDVPFDSVEIFKWNGAAVSVDDLHFGHPIPVPSVLFALGLTCLAAARKRRR